MAGAFFAGAAFLAGAFFAGAALQHAFFAHGFLAGAFFAGAAFLAGAFFAVAISVLFLSFADSRRTEQRHTNRSSARMIQYFSRDANRKSQQSKNFEEGRARWYNRRDENFADIAGPRHGRRRARHDRDRARIGGGRHPQRRRLRRRAARGRPGRHRRAALPAAARKQEPVHDSPQRRTPRRSCAPREHHDLPRAFARARLERILGRVSHLRHLPHHVPWRLRHKPSLPQDFLQPRDDEGREDHSRI